jgi:hypothetical protein
MFVSDQSGFECALARGRVSDEVAVLSVGVEVRYRIEEGAARIAGPLKNRRTTDPPDIRRVPLWRGTSVTAAGTVDGPARPPFVIPVSLAVNGTETRVVVLGPRRWERVRGRLVPGEASRFDEVALEWAGAFGGQYEIQPGIDEDTGLPHPGGRVAYPYNPTGVGFYPDELAAEGQVLPAVEDPAALIREWSDRPRPAGLSPCPGMPAMRMEDFTPRPAESHEQGSESVPPEWVERCGPGLLRTAARMQHHAPGSLIFDWLEAGTPIRAAGFGAAELVASCPAPPVSVATRRGRTAEELRGRVRSVHLDVDARDMLVSFGFATRYAPSAPPQWIDVRGGKGGQ